MPKRIVVVNDDQSFLELMQELLEEEGYAVLVRHAGEDAFEMLRDAAPDLIVLDIRLEHPDSGWVLLENIRLDRALAAAPVIVCSADTREIDRRGDDIRRHNAEVLAKPFDIDDLLGLIKRLVGPPA